MLRQDDFTKMKEMMGRLKKVRVNEAKTFGGGANGADVGNGGASGGLNTGAGKGSKSIPARTSI